MHIFFPNQVENFNSPPSKFKFLSKFPCARNTRGGFLMRETDAAGRGFSVFLYTKSRIHRLLGRQRVTTENSAKQANKWETAQTINTNCGRTWVLFNNEKKKKQRSGSVTRALRNAPAKTFTCYFASSSVILWNHFVKRPVDYNVPFHCHLNGRFPVSLKPGWTVRVSWGKFFNGLIKHLSIYWSIGLSV